MKHLELGLVALSAFALLSACAGDTKAPAPGGDQMTAPRSAELSALFAASDEASLKRNPLQGIYRGDLRYTDRFGEYFSETYIAGERAAADSDLAALARIDRSTLNADDQISYDVFKWQRTSDRRGYEPAIVAATLTRPVDHFSGIHTSFPDLSSGEGAGRYKTVKDYEDGLHRLGGFANEIDTSIARFREGIAAGVTQPKIVVQNMIAQLDLLVRQGVEGSTLYKPVTMMPADIAAEDKLRIKDAYRDVVGTRVVPALSRLRDFMRKDYLPASRDSVGLSAMPGGAALYAYFVSAQTTTQLTPDSIHRIGLSEVARITAGMEAVKTEVGFNGTLQQFFAHIRTDKQFKPASKEALRDGYLEIGKRVDTRVRELFSTIPKAPMEIRPVPAFRERNDAAGSYLQGTPDGSRPGVFYYNTYDLPSRTMQGMETLYLHEGVPGHHFQISLAQENESLPAFQRFGGNTAFVEGWALYAESLGPELGMFKDPYQRYGSLDDEMLRAMRLVVDTGLHEKGWTREQAIEYMLSHSAMGRTDATNEVERYIAMPAQALAYKIGQLFIRRLRTKAERELGAKFDVREFHTQVLSSGALPMVVLEAKIDHWIATKKA
ncbi:MAG: DUF885 domain-containing protein [Gemmatimonas sp.]